jgi:hypothetical protein
VEEHLFLHRRSSILFQFSWQMDNCIQNSYPTITCPLVAFFFLFFFYWRFSSLNKIWCILDF